jgi:hypothetical protein
MILLTSLAWTESYAKFEMGVFVVYIFRRSAAPGALLMAHFCVMFLIRGVFNLILLACKSKTVP